MKRKIIVHKTDNAAQLITSEEYATTSKIIAHAMHNSRNYAKEIQNQIGGNNITLKQLCDLCEEHILKAALLIKPLSQLPPKGFEKYFIRLSTDIARLMKALIYVTASNRMLDWTCFGIAREFTKYLMVSSYKHPSLNFRKKAGASLTMPMLLSPWDSANEIKLKRDEISKRIGLAKIYNIQSNLRFSSLPTSIVLLKYTDRFLFSNRPAITLELFAGYWQEIKNDINQYFQTTLQNAYPEYYRTLRDDRGDKTPIYIKRKLWLQACKQALKGIARANTKHAADDTTTGQKTT